MVTKSITITQEAYDILKSWKKDGDSFSTVIVRIGKRQNLAAFTHVLTKASAKHLIKTVEEMRARSWKRK